MIYSSDYYKLRPFNSVYKEFYNRKIFSNYKQSLLSKSIVPDFLLETFECAKVDKYILYSDDLQDLPAYQCRFCPEESMMNIALIAKEDGGVILIDTNRSFPQSIIQNFKAHKNCIFDAHWLGRDHLITASGDWSIKYHDLITEQLVSQFDGHTASVKSVALRPDHKGEFASSSRDGSIAFWDLRDKSRKPTQDAMMSIKPTTSLFNAHHTSISVSITTPKVPKKQLVSTIINNAPKPVTSIIYANENLLVSSGASDGKIKLWDIRKICKKNTEPVKTISYSGKFDNYPGYTDLIVNRSGQMLFAYCKDGFIYQYDITSSQYNIPVFQYSGHLSSSYYLKMDLSPDENYLVCGSSSYSPYIYHVGLVPQRPVLLNGHKGEVTVCRWCPSNQGVILSISDDCTAMVHRMRPDSPYNVFYRDQQKKESQKPIGHYQAPISVSSRMGEETVNENNQYPRKSRKPDPKNTMINRLSNVTTPLKTKNQTITSFLSPMPALSLFQNSPKPNSTNSSTNQILCENNTKKFPQSKFGSTNLSRSASKKRVNPNDENDENQLPTNSNNAVKRRKTLASHSIARFLKSDNNNN